MSVYRQPSDPPASGPSGGDGGGGLLIALAVVGLLPVVGALHAGEPVEGASAAGFAIALLAMVLLIAELWHDGAKPGRAKPARSEDPVARKARYLSDPRRWS